MDRRTRILLVVTALSLAANVFFFGLWLGGLWQADDEESGGAAHLLTVEFTLPEEVLPPDLRAPLLARLHREQGTFARDLAALRAAREAVQRALTAEPFDRTRLEAAYARLRRAQERLQAQVQRNVAIAVAGLDRERRRMLAERLRILGARQRMLHNRRPALHQAGDEEAVDNWLLTAFSPRYEALTAELAATQAEIARLRAELRQLETPHAPAPDRPPPPR